MPIDRPNTSSLGEGEAGDEQELADVRSGCNELQFTPFLNPPRLQSVMFLHLEAGGKARLIKCDPAVEGGVLRAWPTV